MIGQTVFVALALLGVAFMVYVLAKFHGELKRLKRMRRLHCESERGEWRVLTPCGRGTASFAEPGNSPEQILTIETPNFGAIPLVRTVVSASYSARKEVLNSRKRSGG
jgi:hypothetical protein